MKKYYKVKKEISLLYFGFIIILFISSCSGRGPIVSNNFNPYQGVKEVDLEFMKNSPPEEVSQDKYGDSEIEFPLTLRVMNKGASDVSSGIIALSYEEDYLIIYSLENKKNYNVKGINQYDRIGGEEIIDFQIGVKQLESQSETHTTTVIATTCYDYKTKFSDTICIDTDLYDQRFKNTEKICEAKEKSYSGQGAPVAVTKVIPKSLLSVDDRKIKPEFEIYVENKGDGTVIREYKKEFVCSSKPIDAEDWNKVYVDAYLLNQQLTCKPSVDKETVSKTGIVNLEKNTGRVKCVLEEGIDMDLVDFNTILKIDLSYGYTKSISKQILIRKENY